MSDAVRVEAPARLHLGLIDLRGDLGRRYGGLGAALRHPRVVVETRRGSGLTASGPAAARARTFAKRFLRHHRLPEEAEIRVRQAIPAHVGLGSGTQLALAVGHALAELFSVESDVEAVASAVGRGHRSGVGTWIFERGGFVLEGGRRDGRDTVAPLLFQRSIPASWRCVIAILPVPRGLSGAAEKTAFGRMTPPSTARVGTIARLALMGALPAIVERDLRAFGEAITRIQRHVGECFRQVQGGRFAHPEVERLVRHLGRAGACGVGQSSWGPAVFALAGGEEEALRLARAAEKGVGGEGRVHVTAFDNSGGSCRRL